MLLDLVVIAISKLTRNMAPSRPVFIHKAHELLVFFGCKRPSFTITTQEVCPAGTQLRRKSDSSESTSETNHVPQVRVSLSLCQGQTSSESCHRPDEKARPHATACWGPCTRARFHPNRRHVHTATHPSLFARCRSVRPKIPAEMTAHNCQRE